MRFAVGAPAALGAIVALVAIALGQAGTQLVQIGARAAPTARPPGGGGTATAGLAVTPLHVAMALVVLSLLVYVAFIVAGRFGFGPLARRRIHRIRRRCCRRRRPHRARPGCGPARYLGLPIAWMVVCLLAIPVGAVRRLVHPVGAGRGPSDHRHVAARPHGPDPDRPHPIAMYDYHNNLTAGHAAASPWWAWPFDLKPVWFYQEGFAGSTTAAVYDAGNLVIWWLGVPALGFIAWQAYARRSLGLALVAIAFACQWVSWARIDRAAFQYHYYTSLPFVIMALAYFAAELWHGTSRRIWLFARVVRRRRRHGSGAPVAVRPPVLRPRRRRACRPELRGLSRRSSRIRADRPDAGPRVVVCVSILVFLRLLLSLDRAGPARVPFASSSRWGSPPRSRSSAWLLVRLVPPAPLLTLASFPVEPVVVVVGLLPLLVPCPVRGDGPRREAVRRRDRDRGHRLVPRRLPEHLGAAAAVGRSPMRTRASCRPTCTPSSSRATARAWSPAPSSSTRSVAILAVALTMLCVSRVLGVGLADRARGAGGGRRRRRDATNGLAPGPGQALSGPTPPRRRRPRRPRAAGIAGRPRHGTTAGSVPWKPAGSSPRAARRRMTLP